jgi:DNA (cytosine-5)-methyltransferase 1
MDTFSTLRQAAALSIPEAAKIVGVATSTAYRWDHGEVEATRDALDLLRGLVARRVERPEAAFRFIDLFAGIGGLRRGFDAIGGRCVFTSEWNAFAKQTYLANYYDGPDHVFAGDITKVDAEDIPEHDVLLAGFPCQPFSDLDEHRGNRLADSVDRPEVAQIMPLIDVTLIAHHHRPKVILLEQPKNVLSSNDGKTYELIRRTLEHELGYAVSARLIDARCFVPQRRERLFIAGVRKDLGITVDLRTLELPDAKEGPRLGSILHAEDEVQMDDHEFTHGGKVHARYELSDMLWRYIKDHSDRHRMRGNGFGFNLVGPADQSTALSARYYKDGSDILVNQGPDRNPRRLTPRECSRLMGFDRPGRSDFIMPVSDTQAYIQFGNATVVPVSEALASHLQQATIAKISLEAGG